MPQPFSDVPVRFLTCSLGRLAYRVHGPASGTVTLLLHGFGQNQHAFHAFLSLRGKEERYISIDLFFHGLSSWSKASKRLLPKDWAAILQQLMAAEKFNSFHLVGYSMGGKFSLISYQELPKQVLSLTLLAPDGIKTGFWYNISNFPGIFEGLFKRTVLDPNRFFTWMHGLRRIGLLDKSIVKFIDTQMETRTKRAQVYFTWSVFRKLRPDIQAILAELRRQPIPVTLVTGDFDRMVTYENLAYFIEALPAAEHVALASGHNTLIPDYAEYLKNRRKK
ncbi:alpha/beta fold hydrolase [Nitritalea halalkaliphila]|nr:alpha/beta hydrolase [Nitritalea halalkaliphila]